MTHWQTLNELEDLIVNYYDDKGTLETVYQDLSSLLKKDSTNERLIYLIAECLDALNNLED
jgi:hypothetical protein